MLDNTSQNLFSLELTVVSAQGLKSTACSTLFSHRLRPFITVTTFPPCTSSGSCYYNTRHVFQTRVDDQGGVNPTWGDKFHVPIDGTFFANRYSCIILQLFTKRLIAGQSQLGWCQIPAADIGLPPVGSVRQLSYRLRGGDGTRTQGVVNVTVKLEAPVSAAATTHDTCQPVIGVPVSMMPRVMEMGSTCNEAENLRGLG